jgi:vacuolar-type H+-ATPase subunit I/STV1
MADDFSDAKLIRLLKISIIIGICLLLTGVYLHNFNDYMESLGVTGIIISAVCIAFGLIFSLPTKMYLTFLLVKREADAQQKQRDLGNKNTDKSMGTSKHLSD